MYQDLEGRVAIVTGAAQGIGEAVARNFVRSGVKVAVLDYQAARAGDVVASLSSQGEAIAIAVDMTQPGEIEEAVERTVAQWGRIDILVNNASNVAAIGSDDGNVVSTSFDTWDETYACNLRGPAALCKFAIPVMVANGGGAIINVASVQGLAGDINRCAYGATKAGLIMLSKYIATSFGPQGIRCNSVSPGLVMSPSAIDLSPKEFLAMIADHMPSAHIGAPEDLAELIAFLASNASRYITGENIVADGGLTSHQPFYADLRRGVPAA